jgi:hypothetical protein
VLIPLGGEEGYTCPWFCHKCAKSTESYSTYILESGRDFDYDRHVSGVQWIVVEYLHAQGGYPDSNCFVESIYGSMYFKGLVCKGV